MAITLSTMVKFSALLIRKSDSDRRTTQRRMKNLRSGFDVDTLEVRMLLSATIGGAGAEDSHDHGFISSSFVPQAFAMSQTGRYLTSAQQGEPLQIAKNFLVSNSSSFGISANDWEYRISSSSVSQQTGTTHIYLQQTLGGVDIMNAVANVSVAGNGAVIGAYSSFVATVGTTVAAAPSFSPAQALASFAGEFGLDVGAGVTSTFYASNAVPADVIRFGNTDLTLLSAAGISKQAIPAEPVFIPVKTGLETGWRLNVEFDDGSHWYDAAVSAVSGEVDSVVDWVSDARYTVFAIPKESPSHGGRTNLLDPQDSVASPFGWHDTNGVAGPEFTVTQGNNVTAYTDTDNNNAPDPGSLPDGGASLIFGSFAGSVGEID